MYLEWLFQVIQIRVSLSGRSRRDRCQNHASHSRISKREALNQAVFATHLNVTTGAVSKLELGERQPRDPRRQICSRLQRGIESRR